MFITYVDDDYAYVAATVTVSFVVGSEMVNVTVRTHYVKEDVMLMLMILLLLWRKIILVLMPMLMVLKIILIVLFLG